MAQALDIPKPQQQPRPTPSRRLPHGAALLVDVDGTLPNLALMKLSRHYKAKGCKAVLARGVKRLPQVETVLASCVFSTAQSARRVETLRRYYGDALQVGGSGVSLRLRLAPEIDTLAPDYSLYPELGGSRPGFSDARLSDALPVLRGPGQGRRAAPGVRP